MLRANLQHNNIHNAEVHDVALGAVTGDRTDRIFRLWGTEGEVKTYPFYKLDDFIEHHKIERIDCIKIDVDSFDFEVLRGAEQTLLERNPVVVVELNDALAKRNQRAGEALAWLAQRGYRQALVLDHDNFVLHRGAAAFSGLADCTSLELLFQRPRRIDETMATSAGRVLGASFVKSAWLNNDATLRPDAEAAGSFVARLARKVRSLGDRIRGRDATPVGPAELTFRDIVNVPVETTPVSWHYALELPLDVPAADSMLTIEVAIQVLEGKLGVAIRGVDSSHFSAPERSLAAMAEPQRVVLKAPAKDVHSLIFRNIALDGTKTVFKVLSVGGRAT